MPHEQCFLLDCGRRIPSNAKKNRLGQEYLWPLYKAHVGTNWEESDKGRFICQRCHMKIQSPKQDVTKNFKRSIVPVGHQLDKENVLESRTRSKRSRDEVVQVPNLFIDEEPCTSREALRRIQQNQHILDRQEQPEEANGAEDLEGFEASGQENILNRQQNRQMEIEDTEMDGIQSSDYSDVIDEGGIFDTHGPLDEHKRFSDSGDVIDDGAMFDTHGTLVEDKRLSDSADVIDEGGMFDTQGPLDEHRRLSDSAEPNGMEEIEDVGTVDIIQMDVTMNNSQVSSGTISSQASQQQIENTSRINIPTVGRSQSRCFICHSEAGRVRIPEAALLQVLRKLMIYIPPNNRVCAIHLDFGRFTDEALSLIKASRQSFIMDGNSITQLITRLVQALQKASVIMDFSKDSHFCSEDYFLLLGVTKSQFFVIFEDVKKDIKNSKNRTKENALAVVLMKLRLDVSQKVLALLFGFKTQPKVSRTISKVTKALDDKYASKHVGYQHITRAEALSHSSNFFHQILKTLPESLHVTVDGTYIDIQKPGNLEDQRKTFNLYKHKNLVKPIMIIFDDGYIFSTDGIWCSDALNNDSAIMKKMIAATGPNSIQFILEKKDTFLLDRGYRDCVEDLQTLGYNVFMPELLSKGKSQFSTAEANQSRQVTMLRCGVEMTNGQVKQHFRFLDHKVQNSYIPQLPAFVNIACAIHNQFGTRIREYPKNWEEIVEKVHSNMDANNTLQDLVEEKQMLRKTVIWMSADPDSLSGFPHLTKGNVELLMLGTFQVKMSRRYTQQQINVETGYLFFIHKEMPNLFRAKLKSRFNKRATHQVWIQVKPGVEGVDAIESHYCTCKTGARTVGSCSHVASVLMHFGCYRGEAPSPTRRTRALSLLDAAVDIAGHDEDE